MAQDKKAYLVTCAGFPPAVYYAPKSGTAKLRAMLAGRDAGYRVTFKDLRVLRSPEYDPEHLEGHIPEQGIVVTSLRLKGDLNGTR